MLSYLRRHHLGLIALFFALSGTSYAVATGSISSREIRNGTIVGKDVRNNRLSGADIDNNSLRSRDVRDGALISADVLDASLNGGDLANGSVEGLDVRDGTVGDADLGGNSVSSDELTTGSVRGAEVQNGSLRSQDLQAGLLTSNANVRFAAYNVPASATAGAAAGCPSGQRALGGGVSFNTSDADDRVTRSEPRAGGNVPGAQGAAATGWAGASSTATALSARRGFG